MAVYEGIKFPKVIYETQSDINGKIQVIEVGKTKRLSVSGVVQSVNWDSPAVKWGVWGKLVDFVYDENPNLASVVILGLGGGTMAHLFSNKFPGISIKSVEFDPVMIDIAKKFYDLDKIPNHEIINDDAFRVISNHSQYGISEVSLGAIVVDIYCGEQYPQLGNSGSFFNGIKSIVAPSGMIVFNRIYYKHHQEDVNTFIETVEDNFRDVKSLIVAGRTNSDNVIIIGRV